MLKHLKTTAAATMLLGSAAISTGFFTQSASADDPPTCKPVIGAPIERGGEVIADAQLDCNFEPVGTAYTASVYVFLFPEGAPSDEAAKATGTCGHVTGWGDDKRCRTIKKRPFTPGVWCAYSTAFLGSMAPNGAGTATTERVCQNVQRSSPQPGQPGNDGQPGDAV